MRIEDWFISKSKKFRIHFRLTEADVDILLIEKGVSYTGLELGTKTLTLAIAEAYPLIYGIEYCEFKKDDTSYPSFNELPLDTQDYIKNRADGAGKTAGLKGTKNRASYIICIIKDFHVGHTFSNADVIKDLPYPLDSDGSITWNNGLLKGLVKATRKYQNNVDKDGKTIRSMIYEIIEPVSPSLLEKAKKNIDEGWLEEFEKRNPKRSIH